MDDKDKTTPSADTLSTKGEKPWPVIIMLAMLIVVIASGLLLAPRSEEGKLKWLNILGTTNHGDFLNPPVSLAGSVASGGSVNWTDAPAQPWKLLLINEGDCSDACQAMADMAARVHTRLNRAAPELKRGYLGLNSAIGPNESLGYEALFVSDQAPLDLLTDAGAPAFDSGPLLFLVDPLEVTFMYYTIEHEGNGMLEDIEHVMELAR